jgi:hypothetical protein
MGSLLIGPPSHSSSAGNSRGSLKRLQGGRLVGLAGVSPVDPSEGQVAKVVLRLIPTRALPPSYSVLCSATPSLSVPARNLPYPRHGPCNLMHKGRFYQVFYPTPCRRQGVGGKQWGSSGGGARL